jgi:hypothetical protein
VKCLKAEGRIDSEMTERILKSSISLLEAFNHVRNHQSFAHDNPVLNYEESRLIFNSTVSQKSDHFGLAPTRQAGDGDSQHYHPPAAAASSVGPGIAT